MRKLLFLTLAIVLSVSALAQQKIQLRSADRAECVKSDMTSLKASFSFSSIEATDYASDRGTFSWLSLPNTVIGGNEGDPQIPVINELIAVPLGANPRIEVTSFSSTDYQLGDFGIHTVMPRQLPVRKNQHFEDVPFVMNEAAYQKSGLNSAPKAIVRAEGVMRGVQLGKITIEPVSYDPVNNTLRVFNDIEVTVYFDGADAMATEDLLVETYSPYFDVVYKQLFNGRAVLDAYTEHPDLYTTPVKMLVVTTSTYANSTSFQNWLTWKKQKGIDVDVQTVANNASASTIKSLIYSRYNANHPTFLVIVGDETVVTYYSLWNYESTYGDAATDLEYASVDGDIFHDMFISRMPVSSTTELSNLISKILMYEQYTMPDPSYLDEALLIAGWDDNATAYIGKPTIQYANNYYFNTDHGITPHVFITTGKNQTTCYNYINNVGFVNYTAHGDIQKWHDPQFTNSDVNSLTNANKPFWAMGNCCLTANFKNATNDYTCFGEAMVRAANKGAWGYIGSVPESLWYEDYYFAVGATNTFSQMPTQAQTKKGAYDALFDETSFNTLNAVPFIGNVAVTYAHANGYYSTISDEYYWRAYQCFGDGSVMPYHKQPVANTVSHDNQIPAGASSFIVNADAGSYVSITVNNEIIGVAAVPANATSVSVPFTTTPVAGTTAMIVVTRNQRQPYINDNVPVVTATQYTITATVSPSNAGTASGAGQFYGGEACTLTATPNYGYAFTSWNNNSTANPLTFTVTSNANYTANFRALEEHQVTCNSQIDHGTISANPVSAYMGETITLTATPDPGFVLDYWDVNTISKGNVPVDNNQFVMPDSDVTVSALFKAEDQYLTVYGDNTTTNSYIPIYSYYADYGTRAQFIIPANKLTAMNGAIISGLTFYNNTSSIDYDQEFTVYMKEVDNTTFSSATLEDWNSMSQVYVGSLTVSENEMKIQLTSPYIYTGGNLMIGFQITSWGSTCPNGPAWYGENQSSTTALYNNAGSSHSWSSSVNQVGFIPKTKFDYTPSTTTAIILNPSATTIIAGFSETLTASTLNVTGTPTITYSSSNSNVATVSGSGTTATVTGVSVGTATITATMTYESVDYTATCTITVEEPPYCEPHYSSASDYIASFSTTGGVENISNASNAQGTGGYSNFYNSHYVSASPGTTINFTITRGYDDSYKYAIWVDWNHDYVFDVNTETVAQVTTSQESDWSGQFTIPVNTDGGDYHMRVEMLYGSKTLDPCVSASYGEVEDYKLTVLSSYTLNITGYGTGNGNWYLISSPLYGTTAASDVTNMTNNEFDLYRFNQSAELEWENYKQAGDNYHFDLESGRGYLYANSGNVTLTFSGTPYSGNGQVTISNIAGHNLSGWNLIGNPWSKTATIGKDFLKMNDDHDEIITASSPNIAAMEGIFVYTNQSEETVTFSTGGAKANFTNERIVLNLSHNGGKVIDRAIVRFGNGSTLPKFQLRDNSTKLYIPQNGKDYAVVRINEQGEIPVNFKTYENGQYTLSVGVDDVTLGYLHLIDNLTGNDIDLLATPSYSFNAKTSDYASRFKLVFAVEEDSLDSNFAFVSNGQIVINGQGTVQVIDVLGRIITNVETSYYGVSTENMAPGMYILRLINGSNVKTQKIVIE